MQTSKIHINTGDRLTIITEHTIIVCTVTSVRDRNDLPNNPSPPTTSPTNMHTDTKASTTYIVDKQITTEVEYAIHR